MAATTRRVGEPETVNPMVDDGPSPGVTTMAEMFGQAQVVDQVQESPMDLPDQTQMWVVRPNCEVEDMTLGPPSIHFVFKAGVRYKVPVHVAAVLFNRDMLMEQPYPYDPAMARR